MNAPVFPQLLGPLDPFPYGEINADSQSPFLLICDHAGNAVPQKLDGLGLPHDELNRHIGIDIGALPVALSLAGRLNAPLLFQRYSRLVIDTNRQDHALDSIPPISDGTLVPRNQDLSEEDRRMRRDEIHVPYHAAIEAAIERATAAGRPPIVVSVHSYTPKLRAREQARPWEVALMWADDGAFSLPVQAALEAAGDLNVGLNEPYAVSLENDYSIPMHAHARGLPYVEFEIRQDYIGTPAEAEEWAARLADCLTQALSVYQQTRA
ncbi:N-formylglutamate amidohydrolase [Aureimonas fodinaquatilis]|nr:N-formylglutamate amidohydrolase [Aureimonas fodinaquatilis]